jgi:hypothetical protein
MAAGRGGDGRSDAALASLCQAGQTPAQRWGGSAMSGRRSRGPSSKKGTNPLPWCRGTPSSRDRSAVPLLCCPRPRRSFPEPLPGIWRQGSCYDPQASSSLQPACQHKSSSEPMPPLLILSASEVPGRNLPNHSDHDMVKGAGFIESGAAVHGTLEQGIRCVLSQRPRLQDPW